MHLIAQVTRNKMTAARGTATGVDSELDRYIQKTTGMNENTPTHSWHHWQWTSSQHSLKHTLRESSQPVETCAAAVNDTESQSAWNAVC